MSTATNFASLLVTSLGSLRFLNIHISTFGLDTMSLLCGELQNIAASNFIELLSLNLLIDVTIGNRIQEIQWDLLDKVLLAPEQWLSLQRFDLWVYIDHSELHPVDDEKFDETVAKIRDAQLSGLLSIQLLFYTRRYRTLRLPRHMIDKYSQSAISY